MSEPRKAWKTAVRVGVGVMLLVWIFHCIFVNEARTMSDRRALPAPGGGQMDRATWDALPRADKWRYGWRHGPPALAATLASAEPVSCVAAFALGGGMLFLGVLRWQLVLRVHGLELPLRQATHISLVAHFFNAFLLGTAGGDVAKAYYAARETHHKKTEAVVAVFVDRIIGLWAMLLFGGIMILPNYKLFGQPGLRTACAVLVAMLAAASGFLFVAFRGGVSKAVPGARSWLRKLPKGDRIEQVLEACRIFGRSPFFLTRTLGISFVVNLLVVWQFVVLARGLHIDLPPLALYLVVPLIICIAALPISPAGLGVRENLFVHLLAAPAIGVPATLALSLSLLAYAMSLAWSVVGGVAYMTLKDRSRLRELSQT